MNNLKWNIFLALLFLCNNIYAQSYSNKAEQSFLDLFSINIEYGVSSPLIKGGKSLNIINLPSVPETISNFSETKNFTQNIEPGVVLGLEAAYKIKSWVAVGLGVLYRNNYDYFSDMTFDQEKLILSNDLEVKSMGTYKQRSYLSNTTLTANANFSVLKINLSRTKMAILELGLGGGASFYSNKSSVPAAFLNMHVKNDLVDATYVLGPGNFLAETVNTTTFSWKISTNFSIKSDRSSRVKVGFRVVSLGNFIIMDRAIDNNPLMNLTSTNSGSSDQELSLVSTNSQRTIIAKEFFVKIFLW
jgi:hypothetical protein